MEYEDHVSSKLGVAVAFAVLKMKPPDVPTPTYVLQLQNIMKSARDVAMDIDQISVTSEDFGQDVIEDTMATPVCYGRLDDLDIRNAQNTTDKGYVQHQKQSSLEVGYSQSVLANISCPNEITSDIFDSQECGQRVDNISAMPPCEPYTCEIIINNSLTNQFDENMAATETGYQQKAQDGFTEFHFGPSQSDLFLTQTPVDFSLKDSTKTVVLIQSNTLSENGQIDPNSNLDTAIQITAEKHQTQQSAEALCCLRIEPQNLVISDDETVMLPTENILPWERLEDIVLQTEAENISQTQHMLPPDPNENIEPSTQSENDSQVQSRIELLSQALETNAIVTDMDVESYVDSCTDGPVAGVSFKVLQDLEDVRNFLSEIKMMPAARTQPGALPDSGYRSDSQCTASQMSIKTASRLESAELNQSAHTLVEHLRTCAPPALQHAVTARAAAALAALVDELHARRACPSFLDGLLAAVRRLLEEICSAASGEDAFLEKEQSILRLTLLSESLEVKKYTVELLLARLETFRRALLAEPGAYEARDVGRAEGECYAFHLLETLVVAYRAEGGESEVSEQSTAEATRTPTNLPTSIADIWRKRWDPDHKPVQAERLKSQHRADVVERCRRVLNEFIVSCMDGYALVSFAALECFNSLQP